MDWKLIIQDLIDSGLTQIELRDATKTDDDPDGIAQSTISSILNGIIKEPTWARGDRLLRLHAERCQKQAA